MSQRYVIDVMLGSLSRHLRALGFDVLVKPLSIEDIGRFKERILITRRVSMRGISKNLIVISSEKLDDQLKELNSIVGIKVDPVLCFSRCLKCNTPLVTAAEEMYRGKVPEYIQTTHKNQIRYCETCKRFYWPGTHRKNMEKKFRELGLM